MTDRRFAAGSARFQSGVRRDGTTKQNGACNTEAGDKRGDERNAFMKECLSNKPKVSNAQQAQQGKMKSCNAQASGMKGDERKKLMSECLEKQ